MAKNTRGSSIETARVPIAVLPLDLQLAVRKTLNSGAVPESNTGLGVGLVLMIATLAYAYAQQDTMPFDSSWRMGALFLGIALVITHFRRLPSSVTADGRKRYVLGPASIAMLEGDVVRVIPAEDLTLELRGLFYGEELIDSHLSPDSPKFYQQFQQFLANVKANPSLASQDRFRLAALDWIGRGVKYGRARWLERWVLLPVFGAAIVTIIEAGPIHERAMRRKAQTDLAQPLQSFP